MVTQILSPTQLKAGKGGRTEQMRTALQANTTQEPHRSAWLQLTPRGTRAVCRLHLENTSSLIKVSGSSALLALCQAARALERSSFIYHAKEKLGTFSLLSLLAPHTESTPSYDLPKPVNLRSHLTQLINDAWKGEVTVKIILTNEKWVAQDAPGGHQHPFRYSHLNTANWRVYMCHGQECCTVPG